MAPSRSRREVRLRMWRAGAGFRLDAIACDQGPSPTEHRSVRLEMAIGPRGVVTDVRTDDPAFDGFRGRALRGVRRAAAYGDLGPLDVLSPAAALLDDLPVLWLFRAEIERWAGTSQGPLDSWAAPLGICAGWAPGGELDVRSRDGTDPSRTVVRVGRESTGGCELDPVVRPGSVSRGRSTTVTVDHGTAEVVTRLEDLYWIDETNAAPLHEYAAQLTVDPTGAVTRAAANPTHLPSRDCLRALGSTDRVASLHVEALDTVVRHEFRGTDTCTHLNDVLRHAALAARAATAFAGGTGEIRAREHRTERSTHGNP